MTSATTETVEYRERTGDEVRHGYPPPERPVGSTVVAYCGAVMVVSGEAWDAPPQDTCPDCADVWRRQSAGHSHG